MTDRTEARAMRVIERARQEVTNKLTDIIKSAVNEEEVDGVQAWNNIKDIEKYEDGYVKGYLNALREFDLIDDDDKRRLEAEFEVKLPC